MGYLQAPSTSGSISSHLYSQELQIKLYQAFIFSIPILFSIILFLLFYLFYLKRNFTTTISTSPTSILPPRISRTHASSIPLQSSDMGLKVNLEDKLIVILFDEALNAKDSMCCVCLGEFEMNEKLHQIPSCRHVFHADCIRNWLHSNSTCPLCRGSVITATPSTTKDSYLNPPPPPEIATTISQGSNPRGDIPLEHQESSLGASFSREHSVVVFEGSSSTSMDDKLFHPNEESVVVINIQIHDT